MNLIQAKNDEGKKALDLLKEAAEWLKEQGSSQWSDVLTGEDKHGLAEAVKRGEVFFFYNNEKELVGMVAAWKKPTEWDQQLWGDFRPNKKAVYIHRVIIRPFYRGKNYGEALLTALKNQFRTQGLELRLDCLASNKNLINFYKTNGFKQVGKAQDSNGIIFELFSFI